MPNGDNIEIKSILVMSPIYMTSQYGLYVYQLHIFLEDGICLVREYLTRIYEKCFKGLLSLVGYLVHLMHSWQNGEKDKGPSMESRIKPFEYRVSSERKMILHTILQNQHGSWKYHRRFGKYDGIFVGTEFYFYTCQNMVCFSLKRDCSMTEWHRLTWFWSHAHTIGLG